MKATYLTVNTGDKVRFLHNGEYCLEAREYPYPMRSHFDEKESILKELLNDRFYGMRVVSDSREYESLANDITRVIPEGISTVEEIEVDFLKNQIVTKNIWTFQVRHGSLTETPFIRVMKDHVQLLYKEG